MNTMIKPIDQMTDAELLALAEALKTQARGHQEHAEELRTYAALRGSERRAKA
jgi:hypothetical protein